MDVLSVVGQRGTRPARRHAEDATGPVWKHSVPGSSSRYGWRVRVRLGVDGHVVRTSQHAPDLLTIRAASKFVSKCEQLRGIVRN